MIDGRISHQVLHQIGPRRLALTPLLIAIDRGFPTVLTLLHILMALITHALLGADKSSVELWRLLRNDAPCIVGSDLSPFVHRHYVVIVCGATFNIDIIKPGCVNTALETDTAVHILLVSEGDRSHRLTLDDTTWHIARRQQK